jgi:hypothetical protein
MDLMISAMFDTVTYLSEMLDDSKSYLVSRDGEELLNPYELKVVSELRQDRRGRLLGMKTSPTSSSPLYMRSYNMIAGHSFPQPSTPKDPPLIHTPPTTAVRTSVVTMMDGVPRAYAVVSNTLKTIKGALLEPKLLLDETNFALYQLSSPSKFPSLLYTYEDIPRLGVMKDLAGLLNIVHLTVRPLSQQITKRKIRTTKAEIHHLAQCLSSLLLSPETGETLTVMDERELDNLMALPDKLHELVAHLREKAGEISVDDVKALGYDSSLIELAQSVYQDAYILRRYTNKIIVFDHEPILEYMFRLPSDSTNGRLYVGYAKFPALSDSQSHMSVGAFESALWKKALNRTIGQQPQVSNYDGTITRDRLNAMGGKIVVGKANTGEDLRQPDVKTDFESNEGEKGAGAPETDPNGEEGVNPSDD